MTDRKDKEKKEKSKELNLVLKISKEGKVKFELGKPERLTTEEIEKRDKKNNEELYHLTKGLAAEEIKRHKQALLPNFAADVYKKEFLDNQTEYTLKTVDPILEILNDIERQHIDSVLGITDQTREIIAELNGLGVNSQQTDYLKHQLDVSLDNYRTPELHSEISEIYLSEIKRLKEISQALVEPCNELATQIHDSLIDQGVLESDLEGIYELHERNTLLNSISVSELLNITTIDIDRVTSLSMTQYEDDLHHLFESLSISDSLIIDGALFARKLIETPILNAVKHKPSKSQKLQQSNDELKEKIQIKLSNIENNESDLKIHEYLNIILDSLNKIEKDKQTTNNTSNKQGDRKHQHINYYCEIIILYYDENKKYPSPVLQYVKDEIIQEQQNIEKNLRFKDNSQYKQIPLKYKHSDIVLNIIPNDGFNRNIGTKENPKSKPTYWKSLKSILSQNKKRFKQKIKKTSKV